jgi:hypothetical protein
MANDTPQLRTAGVIAAELGEPLGRVLYVLRTRGHIIKPIGRTGILRVYDRTAVDAVRAALRQMGPRQPVITRGEGDRDAR